MRLKSHFVLAFLIPCSIVSLTHGAAQFQGLGDFPGGTFNSSATAVSADGRVVVGQGSQISQLSDGNNVGFRWTSSSQLQALTVPDTYASAVSYDGASVVGGNALLNKPFLWTTTTGAMPLADVVYSRADAISGDGRVVAGRVILVNPTPLSFRWTEANGVEDVLNANIHALSYDGSVMVGDYLLKGSFRWSKNSGYQFLDPTGVVNDHYIRFSSGTAVSGDGTVVAGWITPDNNSTKFQAFRWTESDGVKTLGDLAGGDAVSQALGISADGSIVVGYGTTDLGKEAFIWDAAYGMRNLKSVLVTDFGLDLTGWTLTQANAISADGTTIVGEGINPDGNTEAFRAVVPEPGSVTMLLAPLVLLAGRWTRARQILRPCAI